MKKFKYKVGDEVVFLTDSYNKGVRFTITHRFFEMNDLNTPHLDIFSYVISNGIQVFSKQEDDLYWIPIGTVDRPKEK